MGKLIEGISFQGSFLSKEEFIPLFAKYYSSKKELIMSEALYIKQLPTGREKLLAWNNFLESVFQTAPIELLAGYEDDTGTHWSRALPINDDVLTTQNIVVRRTQLKIAKQQQNLQYQEQLKQLEDQLQKHQEDYYKQIEEKIDTTKIWQHLIQLTYYRRKTSKQYSTLKNISKSTGLTGNHSYESTVYKDQQIGKIDEAFMLHMFNYHTVLMSMYVNRYINIKDVPTFRHKKQELPNLFKKRYKTMQREILESMNSDSWYKGGDIIVVDSDRTIIYNLQVKSTHSKSGRYYSRIATTNLDNEVLTLLATSFSNPEKLGEQLYSQLKTTAIQIIDQGISERITETIRKISPELPVSGK